MTSRHEVLAQTAVLGVKEFQKKETIGTIASLEETRKSHVTRLYYYLALIGESTDKVPDEKSEWTDVVQSIPKPTTDDLKMSPFEKEELERQRVQLY